MILSLALTSVRRCVTERFNLPAASPWRMCLLTLAMLLPATPDALADQLIASFDEANSETNWMSVNDDVMGGVSRGRFQRTARNTLLFTGNLSLENNGGFASIRSKPRKLNLDTASGLLIRARGDGRTYWVGLRTPGQFGASSYRAYLPTVRGEFEETFIPFSEFKLQAFGRQLPGRKLDPSAVVSLGITIADKKAGPFQFELEWIKAVSDRPETNAGSLQGTIADVAATAGTFRTLLSALAAADLSAALGGEGPFTVFAPTDDAFAKLPDGTLTTLLKPENREKLAGILKYHVVPGRITLAQALAAGKGATLEGTHVPIAFADGRVRIGPATLVQADIAASNGIIHVIDQVLLPPADPAPVSTPVALVELAIERGVPLFNEGYPQACADVYEICCEALRLIPAVSEQSREDLSKALVKAQNAESPREKAWTLRYALDRFLLQQNDKRDP